MKNLSFYFCALLIKEFTLSNFVYIYLWRPLRKGSNSPLPMIKDPPLFYSDPNSDSSFRELMKTVSRTKLKFSVLHHLCFKPGMVNSSLPALKPKWLHTTPKQTLLSLREISTTYIQWPFHQMKNMCKYLIR